MNTAKRAGTMIAGTFIVTGTAVGAGMLAIPTSTAGLWFWRSLLVLGATWLVMMTTSLMILEASHGFARDAHFPTMVKQILGKGWAALNSLSLAFVLYILVYAYIAVGGDLTASNLSAITAMDTPLWIGQLLFFAVLGLVVWLSHRWVARFNTLIIGGLLLTFFMAAGGLLPSIRHDVLLPTQNSGEWRYVWLALPVALTSFGYHINVPTLRIYLQDNTKQIAWALILGSFSALVLYVIWQTAVLGNLPRADFAPVIATGGQASALIDAVAPYAKSALVTQLLGLFTYFAIATSFLGVALGLFEFISDFFSFGNSTSERLKTALIALIAPLLVCLWQPYGFVKAIGFAGMALTIWGAIIPAMMVYKTRKNGTTGCLRVPGGNVVIGLVIAFAVLNIVAMLLAQFGWAPVFTG
ncbi:aromatic amino acid transporter [Cardiobacteriaceae bacterium TAE3-ERU3]|nr:aromatic amino acid transporter [Cardiobacteriaceae bacterium TAE3-ERU3]